MSSTDKFMKPLHSIFYQLCSPFFMIFRILGICPYTQNRNDVFHQKIMSVSSVYTLCLEVVFGYITVTVLIMLFQQTPFIIMSNFNRTLLNYSYVIFFSPAVAVPIFMWFETGKIQVYLQEWQTFQENYNRVLGKTDNINIEKRVARIFQLIIIILMIVGFSLAWLSNTNNILLLVCMIKAVSTIAFIFGFWYVATIIMETMDNTYKKKLEMVTEYPINDQTIEDYRLLWIQICSLIHQAGHYISVTMTFCMLYTSIFLTLATYVLAVWGRTFIRFDYYNALAITVIMLVSNGGLLYVYCNCGYTQTKKITLFLNAINQYNSDMNVAGFYEVNRGLFGTIISLIVTYLIVLIQLHASFNIINSADNNNGTAINNSRSDNVKS